jgi:hypothetical protein
MTLGAGKKAQDPELFSFCECELGGILCRLPGNLAVCRSGKNTIVTWEVNLLDACLYSSRNLPRCLNHKNDDNESLSQTNSIYQNMI